MEYFSAALSSLALVSVASLLAPQRESVRRAALSALSLILLLLLIPKGELDLHALSPLPEAEPPPVSEEYEAVWREGVEKGIANDLCERFSLSPDGISAHATLSFEETEIRLSALSLTLSGKNATADATGILRYIEKSYGVYAKIDLKK